MMKQRKNYATSLVRGCISAGLLVSFLGCGAPYDLSLNASSLHAPLTGRCDQAGNTAAPFQSEVQTLRLVAYPNGQGDIMAAEGPIGQPLTLEGLATDTTYDLTLYGKSASNEELWRGSSSEVVVTDGVTTEVNIMLGKIGDLVCARGPQQEARAFHTATRLEDGKVLIVGGASTMAASNTCSACKSLTATGTVSLFDPGTGSFASVAQLNQPRLLHTATRLADGRVLIAGGVASATLNPEEPFPIVPTNGALLSALEVYDPQAGTVTNIGDDPGGARVFHAATVLASGQVLLSGGVQVGVSPFNLSNATSSTTLCDGTSLACQTGPTMQQARAGHAVHQLSSGYTFVWGGAVGTSYQMERLDQNNTAFSLLSVAAMASSRNLFFASSSAYNDNRILAAGGLVRNSDGSFEMATADYFSTARGPLYVYVPEHGTDGGISVGNTQTSEPLPFAILGPAFFGQATSLGDDSRVMISGGFADLQLTPVDHLALFDESQLTVFEPINAQGSILMSQHRAGHRATILEGGQILYSGGVSTQANSTALELATTSTIFTDEKEKR